MLLIHLILTLIVAVSVQSTSTHPSCPSANYCGQTCCPKGDYICGGAGSKCVQEPKFSHLSILVPIFTVSYIILVILLAYFGYNCRSGSARHIEENIHLEKDPSTHLPLAEGGLYDPRALTRAECPYCHLKFVYYGMYAYKSGALPRSSVRCPRCNRVANLPGGCTMKTIGMIIFLFSLGTMIASSSIMTRQFLIDGSALQTLLVTIAMLIIV